MPSRGNKGLVGHPTGGMTEAESIAQALLEKRYYGPRAPKPVTIRKFSWEEDK